MKQMINVLLLGLLLSLLSSGAAAQEQTQGMPTFESAPCAYSFPPGYRVECGFLLVPEQRSDPDSPTIRVAVAIMRARSAQPEPDPVVFLIGGPGSTLIDSVALGGVGPMIDSWLRNRDVILFDQRGIGQSQPALDCPEVDNLDYSSMSSEAEGEAALVEALRTCAARLRGAGINLDAYTTLASADDAADLPLALGYSQANYYGLSYGSYVVLNVLRRYPERVRSVILEGVTAPDINPQPEFGASFEHALREVIAACEAVATCRSTYPDLEALTFALIAQLDAQPAVFSVTDPQSGQELEVQITGRSLIGTISQQLYYPVNIGVLPAAIYAIAGQQYEVLAPFILNESSGSAPGFSTTGAFYTFRCSDNVAGQPAALFEQSLTTLDPALQSYYRDALEDAVQNCAAWGAAPVAAEALLPVNSAIPVLLLSGRFDPVTPPAFAEHVLAGLPNGYHYVFPTMGHGVGASSNRCGVQLTVQFLQTPASAPDASCLDREPPLVFLLPG